MCCIGLDDDQRIYFRDMFREARAAALKDAEGFQQILFAVERLGSFLKGEVGTLGGYDKCIGELSKASIFARKFPKKLNQWHIPFTHLYKLVMWGRNDALHQGAFARHLTQHAITLSLVLEDALMTNFTQAKHFMVKNPSCAYLWQPIIAIRQMMLENSFSYMPVNLGSEETTNWHLVSDYNLAIYLPSIENQDMRKSKLTRSLGDVIQRGEIDPTEARTVRGNCQVSEIISELQKSEGHPILVTKDNESGELLGILTPYDLL